MVRPPTTLQFFPLSRSENERRDGEKRRNVVICSVLLRLTLDAGPFVELGTRAIWPRHVHTIRG